MANNNYNVGHLNSNSIGPSENGQYATITTKYHASIGIVDHP